MKQNNRDADGQTEGALPSGAKLLLGASLIRKKLEEAWTEIVADRLGGIDELVLVPILDGAIPLACDSRAILQRLAPSLTVLECPMRISRTDGTSLVDAMPRGFAGDASLLNGRFVVVVDDLVDGGKTLPLASRLVREQNPADVLTLVLITKRASAMHADYSCFDLGYADDEADRNWIIGYGMDIDDDCRDLRDIYVVRT